MNNTIFTGAATAIVTPMHADGSINYEEFGKLIDFQIENSIDGIVVCGTTGEASTMTDEEHIEAIRFTVERAAKRVPIIAGTGSNDTGYAIELSKEAEKVGADALLQVTPYYNKTSQRGLAKHFTSIADSVNIPIILYNVPSRTGVNISIDCYKECAQHKNIVATKEASANMSLIMQIAAYTDLDIYSGNDDEVLPALSVGGKGVISVTSNLMPREKHDEVMLYLEGKREEALEIQKKILAFEKALFMDVNPIPVKEALNIMGFKAGECRLPLFSMTDAQKAALRAEMEPLGLVGAIK
ncbi:MAG: 4-hydroxy-tetrahydrodipicolinate synthase [Oscillospiraceae bacterium]|nr:4-hydroxy-tetrahydrodipicolinate synthase [Oscillospiraceae bacterium]